VQENRDLAAEIFVECCHSALPIQAGMSRFVCRGGGEGDGIYRLAARGECRVRFEGGRARLSVAKLVPDAKSLDPCLRRGDGEWGDGGRRLTAPGECRVQFEGGHRRLSVAELVPDAKSLDPCVRRGDGEARIT
jgi:hypothetical protein